jgi:SAM-dependent methyltransferase
VLSYRPINTGAVGRANAGRNAAAERGRRRRWRPARDALWELLGPWLEDGARVGIVGAGNGDDLPLRRIAERAGAVVLLDIDPEAAERARRRLGRRARRRIEVLAHDVTEGAADRIVLTAQRGEEEQAGDPDAERPSALGPATDAEPGDVLIGDDEATRDAAPLPGAPYDLVIGDLFYSQLLYPAMVDLGVPEERRAEVLARQGPALVRDVVARLHASAPTVVHVHDPIAWWEGHEQLVALAEILDAEEAGGAEAALALVAAGLGPIDADPRTAAARLGLAPAATAIWHWPFSPAADYLACGTVVHSGK